MNDWQALVEEDAETAKKEQLRIRLEFQAAFERKLIGRSFRRDARRPAYLLYKP
jgi:hypothetical protein